VTSNLDVRIGRVVYTLMLNKAGGIELDGTITRLAEDRFLVVTPTASQTKTLAMFRRAARGHGAAVFDASAGIATIGIMGPNSRELLSRISPADFSTEAQGWGSAREIEVGNGSALCLRVSFVGEIGYELYPTNDLAVSIYDSVIEAGEGLGLRRAGYHALDSLRVEKGYRHLGHDIGPVDDPYKASLGFAVNLTKGDFLGRSAIEKLQNPKNRQVYIKLDIPEPLFVHDESILLDGKIIGHVTSGAYGHTIGGACGLGYIPADVPAGSNFMVDCGGTLVPATVSDEPFYDPTNARLKA
jgi:4-methylaminobutanoate oxidase (formaldehyde-forming)